MPAFRLGTTCFVYRADLVSNARRLANVVDDIELILYDTTDWGSNFPTREQVAELAAIACDHDLTYTVHLPLDLYPGDARGYDQAQRAIAVTQSLDPFAYVMHLNGSVFLRDTEQETVRRWQARLPEVLDDVTRWVGDPIKVCVENVERWNPDYFAAAVAGAGVSRCVDIGHLWKEGLDPLPHVQEHFAQTRVIHLHGFDGSDHQSLKCTSPTQLTPIINVLYQQSFSGIVTLEVFTPEDFFASRDAVLDTVKALGG